MPKGRYVGVSPVTRSCVIRLSLVLLFATDEYSMRPFWSSTDLISVFIGTRRLWRAVACA
jgi:hypothetical protein